MMTATSGEDFCAGITSIPRNRFACKAVFTLQGAAVSPTAAWATWKSPFLVDIAFVNRAGKSIVLIGFMGTGKSLVGKVLEEKTGFRRSDTDEIISSKLKMPIEEIFSTHGEEYFRDLETETLRSLSGEEPAVVVTGGGIVLRGENVDLLKQMGTVVWLDADEATLRARIHRLSDRPLLRTANPGATLSELLAAREPLYRKVGDLRVDISQKNPEEIADLILKNIRNFPVGE
jgi:shikimate kinase